MSKKIYIPDGENIARRVKKIYIPVDGVAHKVKKIYVGDSENKARQCFSSEYAWDKYVSYKRSTTTMYEDEVNESKLGTFDYFYYPNDISYTATNGFFVAQGDGAYTLTVYSAYNYSNYTGTISTSGCYSKTTTWLSSDPWTSDELYNAFASPWDMQNYAWRGDGYLYRLYLTRISSEENYHVVISDKIKPGDPYPLYTFSYQKKGIVTSENENAYTEGSVADYTSRDANDIRTVYVKNTTY